MASGAGSGKRARPGAKAGSLRGSARQVQGGAGVSPDYS